MKNLPQIITLLWMLIMIIGHAIKHGQPRKSKINVWWCIFFTAIDLSVLWWGGFFDGLFK